MSSSPSNTTYTSRRRQAALKGPMEQRKTSSSSSSSTKSKQQQQEEVIEKMRANLSRFARVGNKRMAIRTLQDCRYLRSVPLDTAPPEPSDSREWKSLEKEVCWTNVQLNGLLFRGSHNSQILKVVKALCQELCKELHLSSHDVYTSMVVRLASTSNSSDSYFQLNSLLGSQDLVLQLQNENNGDKKKKLDDDLPPTSLQLYQAGGEVHAVLTAYIPYGLFRRSDIKSGKPWISLLAQVHERINLSTGISVRQVQAQITTPEQ